LVFKNTILQNIKLYVFKYNFKFLNLVLLFKKIQFCICFIEI